MQQSSEFTILPYQPIFEKSWVRCKALAYLHSQFIDQMSQEKDIYSEKEDGYKETIELVALFKDEVVGLIDIGIYSEERTKNDLYVKDAYQGSYVDAIAIHPDFQKLGIAQSLWDQSIQILKSKDVHYLTIFTRDDLPANQFYQKNGAQLLTKHYRVKGQLKQSPYPSGKFMVDPSTQKIGELDSQGNPLPYSPDYPHTFWVYEKEDLKLFNADSTYIERSYVLYL
ncbi:N-acetyltransferase [Marinilactibacillus sp. Marseille-P9653]|uniref:GNAT family N-acetyltransferase n=1 Tax=Marinilactibacillus sp. Marseille-P9653 TaxID=2866583 RepID=UPI001CE3FD9D|nr:GNAT family N-acetyltransferase [Marinilactibacillus sp. Marseille-P9653]